MSNSINLNRMPLRLVGSKIAGNIMGVPDMDRSVYELELKVRA